MLIGDQNPGPEEKYGLEWGSDGANKIPEVSPGSVIPWMHGTKPPDSMGSNEKPTTTLPEQMLRQPIT